MVGIPYPTWTTFDEGKVVAVRFTPSLIAVADGVLIDDPFSIDKRDIGLHCDEVLEDWHQAWYFDLCNWFLSRRRAAAVNGQTCEICRICGVVDRSY
jgi:hypothetical protein